MDDAVQLPILFLTIYSQMPLFAIDFCYICGVKGNQKKRMEKQNRRSKT